MTCVCPPCDFISRELVEQKYVVGVVCLILIF